MISHKVTLAASDKNRIDAKYFSKAAVKARQLVDARANRSLGQITAVLRKGIFDIKADTYTEAGDGVPFVRISDLGSGVVHGDRTAWISEDAHQAEISTALSSGDIAISKTAYPAAALINVPRCNVSQDVIATRLSPAGKKMFHEEYVVAFLRSSLGMELMAAEFQGNVQEHLGLGDARRLKIPVLGRQTQDRIRSGFRDAIKLQAEARRLQESAESQMAVALGLSRISDVAPLTYHVKAKSAAAAKRLDAEYFAPRITRLISLLGKSNLTLADVAPMRREKFDRSIQRVINYIEIGDLAPDGTAAATSIDSGEAPSRAAWHVRSGDVITSTVRPIRRLSALIEKDQDGAVCSSGFVVLQPKKVRPEILLTYLKLPLFCELMNLHTSASMYPAISDRDLLALPFSPVEAAVEKAVCEAVGKARQARQRAAKLLFAVTDAVAVAMERSEAEAVRMIEKAAC